MHFVFYDVVSNILYFTISIKLSHQYLNAKAT